MNPMATRLQLAGIIALVVILSVAAAYDFLAAQGPSTKTETVDTCDNEMTFNGTVYCSLDVTGFTTLGIPGYSYMSRSVNFMGVLFQTVCPSDQEGCPSQKGTTVTAWNMGVLTFNMTFADGTSETLTALLGDTCPPPMLTQNHYSPRAGFYLDCVSGSLGGQLKLFLLVEATQ
jgi:hypothetical protein